MRTEMLNGWIMYTEESDDTLITLLGYAVRMNCSVDLTILQENPGMNKLVVHGTGREMNHFKKMCEISEIGNVKNNTMSGVFDLDGNLLSTENSLEEALKQCQTLANAWVSKRKGIYDIDIKETVTNSQIEITVYEGRTRSNNKVATGWIAEVIL